VFLFPISPISQDQELSVEVQVEHPPFPLSVPYRLFFLPLSEDEVSLAGLDLWGLEGGVQQPSFFDLFSLALELGGVSVVKVLINSRYPDGELGATIQLQKGGEEYLLLQVSATQGILISLRKLGGVVMALEELIGEYEVPANLLDLSLGNLQWPKSDGGGDEEG
jgi:hypothetical protein